MNLKTCYCSAAEIVAALQDASGERKDLSSIIEFFKPHDLMEERTADHASSLIILTAADGRRLFADLHVAERLTELPLIKRTGTLAPWMSGSPLGFNEDVTDPDLQRKYCVPLTALAAAKEGFVFFLKAVERARCYATAGGDPQNLISEYPHERDAFGRARDIASAVAAEAIGDPIDTANEICKLFKDGVGSRCTFKLSEEATRRLHSMAIQWQETDLRMPGVSDKADRLGQQTADFFSAFTTSMDPNNRERAHLGTKRLDKIFYRPNASGVVKVENAVIQGSGDLSMNQWNVAYYTDPRDPSRRQVLIPENEPYNTRTYNCLIGWEPTAAASSDIKTFSSIVTDNGIGVCLKDHLAIARLRILPGPPHLRLPDHIHLANQPRFNLGKMARFALYGKLVLRSGEVVDPAEVIDEFQDLRHVVGLCNLNPAIPNWDQAFKKCLGRDGKPAVLADLRNQVFLQTFKNKPRNLFGQQQSNDVWLLEYALLQDTNLRRLACAARISVGLTKLGAPLPWVHFCLLLQGYQPVAHEYDVRGEGQFAWDWNDRAEPKLVIWLRKGTYPCTMVGIGTFPKVGGIRRENGANALYLLAWGHEHARGTHTIWDCAKVLKAAGASFAVVIDEGNDVFQAHIPNRETYKVFADREENQQSVDEFMPVPIAFGMFDGEKVYKRRSLRASIAFWQESD